MSDFPNDAIENWWKSFCEHLEDIELFVQNKTSWSLWEWMIEELAKIDKLLVWEFGPGVAGKKRRLVITCESARELRPLVAEIIRTAPELPDWEFHPYRLPERFEDACDLVTARAGRDVTDVRFAAALNPMNLIDLVFCSKLFVFPEDPQGFADVFTLIETMLGEKILDHRIGAIELEQEHLIEQETFHARELKTVVEALIEKSYGNLPKIPYSRMPESAAWGVYELNPRKETNGDFPWFDDVVSGVFLNMEIARNIHYEIHFESERYSKFGESFYGLKIETGTWSDELFDNKRRFEDMIDNLLKEKNLGCLVGTCAGIRYSYIVLALESAPAKAFEEIRASLQISNASKNSWFFPLDTDLRAIEKGIWPDTPPMPKRSTKRDA